MLNQLIRSLVRECLNERLLKENSYSKRHIYNDIQKFLSTEFYSGVKYSDLLHSCELSKGNCMDVSEELALFFKKLGYNGISLVVLRKPKFNLSKSHEEYAITPINEIFHQVVKVGDYYIDLTGAQFSPELAGIKIYTKVELSKLYGEFEVIPQ